MAQEQRPTTGLNTVAIVAIVVILVLGLLALFLFFPNTINIIFNPQATPQPQPTSTPILTVP